MFHALITTSIWRKHTVDHDDHPNIPTAGVFVFKKSTRAQFIWSTQKSDDYIEEITKTPAVARILVPLWPTVRFRHVLALTKGRNKV